MENKAMIIEPENVPPEIQALQATYRKNLESGNKARAMEAMTPEKMAEHDRKKTAEAATRKAALEQQAELDRSTEEAYRLQIQGTKDRLIGTHTYEELMGSKSPGPEAANQTAFVRIPKMETPAPAPKAGRPKVKIYEPGTPEHAVIMKESQPKKSWLKRLFS